jgi:hypothetical protein
VFWRCFLFLSAGNLFGWVESSPNCICKQVGCSLLFSRRTARPILWKWLSFNYSAFAPSAFKRLGLLSRMPTKSKQTAKSWRLHCPSTRVTEAWRPNCDIINTSTVGTEVALSTENGEQGKWTGQRGHNAVGAEEEVPPQSC